MKTLHVVAFAAVLTVAGGSAASAENGSRYRTQNERGNATSQDNVGSVARDRNGRQYNRFSGQRLRGCVIDDGYGRTRPCDAGGAPR